MRPQLLLAALLQHAAGQDHAAAPVRVLFIGDSFGTVPAQLAHIAASLKIDMMIANSTRRDCTAYALRPQKNSSTTRLLHAYEWDFIVTQTVAALPTIVKARSDYMRPAMRDIIAMKKQAKVVMYMPRADHGGISTPCPATPTSGATSDSSHCFPLGTLAELTNPPCSTSNAWHTKVKDVGCMSYALARGVLSTMEDGADMVAPCGLAWQAVSASGPVPFGPSRDCMRGVDAEYPTPSPLNGAALLPLLERSTPDLRHIPLWNATLDGHNVTHWRGTAVGDYLDALVLFTTLFGTSPVGCATPLADAKYHHPSNTLPQSPLSAQNASQLQELARSIVLSHQKLWGSTVHVLPANPTSANPLLFDLEVGVGAGLGLLIVCALLRPLLCPPAPPTPRPRSRHRRGQVAQRGGSSAGGGASSSSGGAAAGSGSGSASTDPLLAGEVRYQEV